MSFETVLSIAESGAEETTISHLIAAYPASGAAHRAALEFFRSLPGATERWVARIGYLRSAGMDGYIAELGSSTLAGQDVAFQSALGKIAANEATVSHAASIAEANAAASAAEGTLTAGAGTTTAAIVLPAISVIAVSMALGAPVYQAREEARKEGYITGFATGFVTGLLDWDLRFTISRFWDQAARHNPVDGQMPIIRAHSYNQGLIKGRIAGLAKAPNEKRAYLRGLRRLAHPSSAGWQPRSDNWMEKARARQVQISYVIDLMGAAVRSRLIRAE